MNNSNKLRWGILGAARINQQLMPAIVAAKNSELVAIASRRPGAAAETLAQYAPDQSDVRIYNELDALLEDPDIQAVYIPLSNHEHGQWVLRAIKQGKHVLCEKPLALTVADIEAIETAAAEHGVTVMEGFMYRFHPQHSQVKALIASGLFGEIRSVRSCFSFMMQPARMYRLAESIDNGGGAMWDIGCYAINAARLHLLNESPVAVSAISNYSDSGVDLGSSGIIDYGNGRFAQFDYSFERARRAEYEIIGCKGGLKCHNVWAKQNENPVISWWTESGQQCEEKLLPSNHFLLEIEHFSDCILNNQSPGISLSDSKESCQIINAALQSSAQGQKILLD